MKWFDSSMVPRLLVSCSITGVVLFVSACVQTPSDPNGGAETIVPGGVYTVCEGLWQQNNASLSYRDPNGTTLRDAYRSVNGGEPLGDTPTDIVVLGDTLIIGVSTSRELIMVHRRTGEVIKRQTIGASEQPYRMALAGDRLYVSSLNSDVVIEFDAKTLERTTQNIPVGPAPEGVAVSGQKLYVAVSGLGDLRSGEPLASTVQILRRSDMTVVGEVDSLWNVADVVADPDRQLVWATYRHFASEPDSLGGIVAIDTRADTIVLRRSYASPTRMALDRATGIVYLLHQDGIESIQPDGAWRRVVDHASTDGNDIWYTLWLHPETGQLYVGNARNYVTDGEVLIYSVQGALVDRYPVGLNPTAFAY